MDTQDTKPLRAKNHATDVSHVASVNYKLKQTCGQRPTDLVSLGPGGGKEIELLDRLKFPRHGWLRGRQRREEAAEERCGGWLRA